MRGTVYAYLLFLLSKSLLLDLFQLPHQLGRFILFILIIAVFVATFRTGKFAICINIPRFF